MGGGEVKPDSTLSSTQAQDTLKSNENERDEGEGGKFVSKMAASRVAEFMNGPYRHHRIALITSGHE